MIGFQFLLVILAALGISAFASRRGLPPGVVVVLVGTAVSFVPDMPRFEFSSHLILGAIMPPLLFSASREFPISRFAANSRSIFGLGVILVIITTVIVGLVANLVLPVLTISGAFVLAAIVSPPDTITTVVHGREFGLTNRCISILTGESIVNDAAALTLFTAATLAVTGSKTWIGNPALLFVYAAVVGLLVGVLLGNFASIIRLKMDNPSAESVVGIILPFAAYLTAEELHASGVLAVVTSGFTLAIHSIFNARAQVSAATRVQESAIWPAIDALLESVVFAFIGLQAKYVLETLRHEATPAAEILTLTAIILALLVVIRMVWVFFLFSPNRRRASYDRTRRRVIRRDAQQALAPEVSDKEAFLIGWTGMRGIVTIGAAASLPLTVADGGAFPARDEIQTVAYLVAFVTLIVQASLLPVFARRFNLDLVADDREANREITAARMVATAAEIPPDASDAARFDARRIAIAQAVRHNQITDFAARVVIQGLDHAEIAQSKRAAIFAADEDPLPSPIDK